MPGQQYANTFVVSVRGTPLRDDLESLLVSAYVEDNLHLPDVFELRFRDPDRQVLPQTGIEIGDQIGISVIAGERQVPEVLLLGEVTSIEASFDATGTYTVVRGMDASHRLFRNRGSATYQQVTLADVVRTVGRRAGVQLGDISSTSTVFEHIGQAGVSDWQFLRLLARESGAELTVNDGRLTLHAPTQASSAPATNGAPASNALVLQLGTDLLRLRATVTGTSQADEIQVRSWDGDHKKTLVSTAPARSDEATISVRPQDVAKPFGKARYVSAEVPYGTQAEVDEAAKALAGQLGAGFVEVEALARGNPELRAGRAIAIGNFSAPFDGKYTLTATRHSYDPHTGYTVRLSVSGRQDRSLLGLAGGSALRGDRSASVVVGQVSDIADPEDRGRVKVSMPWLNDSYVTHWARTVQPGAGPDRGALVLPEVGDEVLVAFEQGDPRRPYVLGGLHSGTDKPPKGSVPTVDSAGGKVQRRAMVSRQGHRLELLDSTDEQGVDLRSGDGKVGLRLDAKDTKVTVHSDGSVTIEARNGIKLDAQNSKIALTGSEISLTARRGVTIDAGTGTAKLTSSSGVEVTGTQVKVKGSAQTEVKGGASLALSAGLVRIN